MVSATQERFFMKITEREENGITVYVLDGRIDSEGAVYLDETLQAGVEAGKFKMVLDMTMVQYINSAALRTLADVITKNQASEGDLKLAALAPKVQRVLQLVGFDKFANIYPRLDEALADF
jgi:anti-sigma B factor antagonist